MTDLLQAAFDEVSKLPPEQQNAIAGWLIKELESERRWDNTLANSQSTLSSMASEALAEHRQGLTQDLDVGQ